MLECRAANAGFAELLSKTISADSVRAYKTSPKTYGLVLSTFSVLADEVPYVSSHGWDVLGGTWFGFMTLWVNRQSLPLETLGPKPNFVGTDLSRAREIVSSQSAQYPCTWVVTYLPMVFPRRSHLHEATKSERPSLGLVVPGFCH